MLALLFCQRRLFLRIDSQLSTVNKKDGPRVFCIERWALIQVGSYWLVVQTFQIRRRRAVAAITIIIRRHIGSPPPLSLSLLRIIK